MNKRTLGLPVWGLAGVLGLAVAAPSAWACSCLEPSVERSWHESSDVLLGRVLGERLGTSVARYRVVVKRPFSGCTEAGQVVEIQTPSSSASCGLRLEVGETYVLSATPTADDPEVYQVISCGYNRVWSEVGETDRDYLRTRPVYCDETGALSCASGERPIQCFADPCRVDDACETSVTCESNPCSAEPCAAEHYDEDWGQTCLQ